MPVIAPLAAPIAALTLAIFLVGGAPALADEKEYPAVVTELQQTDVVVGEGDVATAGKSAVVHYTGWLYDPSAEDARGTKFDSSVDRGQPFRFPLGAGRVIKGWDEGVQGMKVGGKRVLVIPSDMAYGNRGAGRVIPPGATLVFEVELLGVE